MVARAGVKERKGVEKWIGRVSDGRVESERETGWNCEGDYWCDCDGEI